MQAARLFTIVLVFFFISATADSLTAQSVVAIPGTSPVDSMVLVESPTTEDPIVINLAADGITYTTECRQLSAFGGAAFDVIVDESSRTINISVTGDHPGADVCSFLLPDPVNGIRCSVGRLAAGDWEVQTSFPGASPPSSTFGETFSFTVNEAPTRRITYVPLYTFQDESVFGFGSSVSGAGDVNGDGTPDLIVGAPGNPFASQIGSASVLSGSDGSVLYEFNGGRVNDRFGGSVSSAGDVNGDGFADLIVGASGNNLASVLSGSDGSVLFTFDGDGNFDNFGFSVSGADDVNGDGFADLIVGTRGFSTSLGDPRSYARVFSGSDGSVLYNFDGVREGDFFGGSVSGAGDVNGDGTPDLIVGAYRETNNGRAHVFSGSDGSTLFTFDGDNPGDEFGRAVSGAGDVNGDGFADLIVGARADDNNGLRSGSARVLSGSDGSVLYTFDGDSAGDAFGWSVGGVGDVNGDGLADLIVGTGGLGTRGYARVYSGADGRAIYTFEGDSDSGVFGRSVSSTGDLNGDGIEDFIVGALGGGANDGGYARVFVSQIFQSPLMGDVNLSGTVDFFDISSFISLLASGTYQSEADFSTDGVVNFLDIAPFIATLAGL